MNITLGLLIISALTALFAFFVLWKCYKIQRLTDKEILISLGTIEKQLDRTTTGNLSHSKGNIKQIIYYIKHLVEPE